MLPDRRRALLIAALGFLQLREQPPEVAPLRRWLDSWTGLEAVVDGMVRQGFVIRSLSREVMLLTAHDSWDRRRRK
jgi:hypothetical protein